MADLEDPAEYLLSSSAMPSDERDWAMGDLVEVEEGEQVEVKRRLRNLQELCHAKRRKVPESVSNAVGLAVELVDDAVITSSPEAGLIVDPRIDELTGQLASNRKKVVSLTAKLSHLEDARDKTEQEHENFMRKIRKETKTSEDHTIAERDGALSRYHGVLQTVRGIV